MSPQKKIILLLSIAALAVSVTSIASAEQSTQGAGEVATPKDSNSEEEAETIGELHNEVGAAISGLTIEERKSTACECNKGEPTKPTTQALGDKATKSKKSGKKFKVITISIPVESESSELVEVVDDSAGSVDVKSEESAPEVEVEEVEEASPKKESTLKTKSDKKRSKRSTKGKTSKPKKSSKVGGEKGSSKGKGKK